VIETARAAGLLCGEFGHIGARIRRRLLDVAKARAGIVSNTELLEYALARVALEDDFGPRLLALKGSMAAEFDLEL
jgi:hypothetical protein